MIQNVKLPLNGTELIEALVNDWGGFLREYRMALNELTSDFQIVDLEWKTKYGYSPIEHLKSRMKTPVSLIKKCKNGACPLTGKAYGQTFMISSAFAS
ncbi:hypothetical protein ABNC90_07485 [Paenibacillus larvae]|uniref:hypothetical protein n=1 Tax=Paenibacillus larvae TaxID=1464 RepID=UPI00288E251A|nr:hypothetical protein [Paenibacillus larvae]MDT2236910.1 hypothetical protein [Paenibacillus larvae]MDT2285075.1 hypothetical protein [Paenibacillus larvae]